MRGKTCAGTWVSGRKDGADRQVYLYHVVDNEWSMAEYGSQAVVWQTAVNPVVALELLAAGTWSGAGVLGPEAFDAVPFLDLLTAYGSPWGMREGGWGVGLLRVPPRRSPRPPAPPQSLLPGDPHARRLAADDADVGRHRRHARAGQHGGRAPE